ncbi:MAG: hypothetical protein OXB88_01160 [Bacteriovoracales bacterium]|nr:hypothetical protein [Bacteriovoracales bacterium]
MRNHRFKRDGELARKLKNWWEDLENQKGFRSELRRARNANDVIFVPSFHRSCQSLDLDVLKEGERWAIILGLLSHVKKDDKKCLLEQIALKVKGPRFLRLLQRKREDDGFYMDMMRIIRLLKNELNIIYLAESVYYWGADRKKEWAFAYFQDKRK